MYTQSLCTHTHTYTVDLFFTHWWWSCEEQKHKYLWKDNALAHFTSLNDPYQLQRLQFKIDMLIGMHGYCREGPCDQFVLGNLAAKHCFTLFLWCLVLGISPLVFSSDWYFLAITGSVNLLPYFIAGSLMIWPWTSVVISGVIFTIQRSDGWLLITSRALISCC